MRDECIPEKSLINELSEHPQRVAKLKGLKAQWGKVKNAFQSDRTLVALACLFVLVCSLILANEILDLPHLLLGTPSTYINWQEVIIEAGVIFIGGLLIIPKLAIEIAERKQAEEMIRESEKKFRTLAEQSPNMIFMNKMGNVVYANQWCEEVMGYTRKEFFSPDFDFMDLIAPDSTELIQMNFNQQIEGKDIPPYECALITKGGDRVEAIITTKIIQYEKENAILGIVTDITERVRMEKELRKSEERFDLAVIGSSDGLWDRDPITGEEWWSPLFYELLGYEDGEFESSYEKFTELLHPEDRDRVVEVEQAHLEKRVPFDIQYRLLTKSGEYRWFRARAQAIWDENDNPIRIAGSIQDITERMRIENDLKQSEERFRELIEKAGIGISIDDVEGNLVYVNQTFADMHGYTIEEILAQSLQSLTHPDDVERAPGYHAARIQGQEAPSRYEFRGVRKNGSVIHLETDVVLLEEGGRTTGTLAYLWDISDRVRAEEQLSSYAAKLEQANEEIKQFAYIISHDFRAPLVNLKGFAAELGSALEVVDSTMSTSLPYLDEKQKQDVVTALREDVPEALGFIDSSVTRMDHLISALLKLSRLGRHELHFAPVNMNSLVQTTLETLAHTIEERQVKVTVGSLPKVVADRTSMEQIMGNILSNAVKYLDPDRPGEIEVTAERGDDETTFLIHDNGRGIAEEDMPKVFAPFRRIGRQDQPGEGMGLPYVQTLVRRHGGRIWCESELELGTTFAFTISKHLAKGGYDAQV